MSLIDRFNLIFQKLSPKDQRGIHAKSIRNFIIHEGSMSERDSIRQKLEQYMELVEVSEGIDDVFSMHLFQNFVMPIGEQYSQIGFVRITALRYQFLYAFMIDSLVFIIYFPRPYIVATVFVVLNHFLFKRRYYNRNKVFGMFY